MANVKISDLTDGTAVAAGDLVEIERPGTPNVSRKVPLGTAAGSASTDFATSAQGTTADAALPRSGGQMSGNITMAGAQTVDGRDLSADGTKLDGIESGADVTDAANVASAGAVMVSDTSTASMSFVIDEDNMASNSATKVPTQQSVKAYVDASVHDAVTVSDSSEIDFTLTGQQISAEIKSGSIDETKLDASVNASLDLADSALQAGAIGTTVQGYDTDLTTWAGLTPSANHQTLVTQTFAQMRASLDLEAGTDFYSIAAANAAFQPIDSDLTSWAGVTRASGFDTFVATPSSANLKSLITDETGSGGALVFATGPTLTDPQITGAILEDIYTITDGAGFEIDPSNGTIQQVTLGADRTPAATNFANGESVTLMVNDGTARTITWTTVAVTWVGGSAPTLATSGWTVIELWKVGNTIYGAHTGNVA